VNVIENNNIMCIVMTIDTMERSLIPIVIYSVESELDSFATKDNNRQSPNHTRKLLQRHDAN
jgi:hypothetical protein